MSFSTSRVILTRSGTKDVTVSMSRRKAGGTMKSRREMVMMNDSESVHSNHDTTATKETRTTRRPSRILPASTPSFKQFIHRSKVICQYRDFMRTLSILPKEDEIWKQQLLRDIRNGYDRYKTTTDPLEIQMALRDGEQQLKQIQSVVGYQRNTNSSNNNDDPDSWLNIDDKDDPRGRVGDQWPWQK